MMKRAIEDLGGVARVNRPLQIKRYEPGDMPDPGGCVDCLIVVNDRADGKPRGRLYVSNGGSWDPVAWLSETGLPTASVDVTALVRRAVSEALPAIVQAAAPQIVHVPAPAIVEHRAELGPSPEVKLLAQMLSDLETRVAFLEHNALAEARLEKAA